MSFAGKHMVKTLKSITLEGEGGTVNVLIRDKSRNILWSTGTTVPGDVAGHAKGALFIDTDVADGTTGLYVNVGTTASADYDAVSDA